MKYVKDEKFNFKSWLDDVEKFNKNKKFIKFDIKVKYDGKFKFCINNAGKYKNAVKELKDVADEVIGHVDENGLEEYLKTID